MEAAALCLDETQGELTSRDVIARAGVSTGTLYHYFPSMDLLLMAVANRRAAGQATIFGSPDHPEGLEAILGRLFAPERADTALPWLRHKAIKDDALRLAIQSYDRGVNDWLVSALGEMPKGVVRDGVDVEAVVEIVRCLAEGYQLRRRSATDSVDPERFLSALIDVLRRGCAPGLQG